MYLSRSELRKKNARPTGISRDSHRPGPRSKSGNSRYRSGTALYRRSASTGAKSRQHGRHTHIRLRTCTSTTCWCSSPMPAAHISHLGPVGTTRDEAIRVSTSPTVTFMTGLRSRLGHRYHRIVSKRDREHSVANQHRHRRQVLGAGAHPRSRPVHTEVGRARRTGEDSGVSGRTAHHAFEHSPRHRVLTHRATVAIRVQIVTGAAD